MYPAALRVTLSLLLCVRLSVAISFGQTSDEHASHHPQEMPPASAAAASDMGSKPKAMSGAPGAPAGAPMKSAGMGGAGGAGGMESMMREMMKSMMGAPQKELYPSLMALPTMPSEQRLLFQKQGESRAKSGAALLQQGMARMTNPAANDLELQEGAKEAREGLRQLESGQEARRALAEGRPPRAVALEWFQPEMNLKPLVSHSLFGDAWWHILVIAILSAFVMSMLAMYFSKMRRAGALLKRLADPDAASKVVTIPFSTPPVGSPAAASSVSVPVAAPTRWKGVLRVTRIFQETHNVKTFRMMSPDGELLPFTYLPGQFATVSVAPNGKRVTRSYTIASSPTERDYMELTVKREEHGVVSGHLNDHLSEGDLLEIAGPSGRFAFDGKQADCIAFIAGGVGITPMMSAIRFLTARAWPGDIFLLYSCHAPQDYIFRDELEYLQRRNPNLHLFVTMSKAAEGEWSGLTGRFTKEIIAKCVPEIASRHVHLCGPVPFMDSIKQMLEELGVPKEMVDTETFAAPPREETPQPEAAKPAVASDTAPIVGTPDTAPIVGVPATLQVSFSKSGKSAPMPPDKTVLEASEDIGVDIPFECRVGTCGICKTKLVSGTVTMEIEDALERGEKQQGWILACQAKATSALVVEA